MLVVITCGLNLDFINVLHSAMVHGAAHIQESETALLSLEINCDFAQYGTWEMQNLLNTTVRKQ